MDALQVFIFVMGLAGHALIARKNSAGYAFWIAGSIALMFVYIDLRQYGLIGVQVVNVMIQAYAISRWVRDSSALPQKLADASPLGLAASNPAQAN